MLPELLIKFFLDSKNSLSLSFCTLDNLMIINYHYTFWGLSPKMAVPTLTNELPNSI